MVRDEPAMSLPMPGGSECKIEVFRLGPGSCQSRGGT